MSPRFAPRSSGSRGGGLFPFQDNKSHGGLFRGLEGGGGGIQEGRRGRNRFSSHTRQTETETLRDGESERRRNHGAAAVSPVSPVSPSVPSPGRAPSRLYAVTLRPGPSRYRCGRVHAVTQNPFSEVTFQTANKGPCLHGRTTTRRPCDPAPVHVERHRVT